MTILSKNVSFAHGRVSNIYHFSDIWTIIFILDPGNVVSVKMRFIHFQTSGDTKKCITKLLRINIHVNCVLLKQARILNFRTIWWRNIRKRLIENLLLVIKRSPNFLCNTKKCCFGVAVRNYKNIVHTKTANKIFEQEI